MDVGRSCIYRRQLQGRLHKNVSNTKYLEDQQLKPTKLEYPVHRLDYKHYGYNVHIMIKKALNMEEGPVKKEFVEVIGAYMKLAYKTWNKEHFVSDDMIRQDLLAMTKGALSIDEEKDLDVLLASQIKKKIFTYCQSK